MRWAGHVACIGENRGECMVLEGTCEGNRPLVRPRHRWEDNIKVDVMEIVWEGMCGIDLVHDRDMWRAVVNVLMNLLVT
jgi:hypothetical protein